MKCELAADTPLTAALPNNSGGRRSPDWKQLALKSVQKQSVAEISPHGSRALPDLLNKQTSDSNLSVYTDADLQCK